MNYFPSRFNGLSRFLKFYYSFTHDNKICCVRVNSQYHMESHPKDWGSPGSNSRSLVKRAPRDLLLCHRGFL